MSFHVQSTLYQPRILLDAKREYLTQEFLKCVKRGQPTIKWEAQIEELEKEEEELAAMEKEEAENREKENKVNHGEEGEIRNVLQEMEKEEEEEEEEQQKGFNGKEVEQYVKRKATMGVKKYNLSPQKSKKRRRDDENDGMSPDIDSDEAESIFDEQDADTDDEDKKLSRIRIKTNALEPDELLPEEDIDEEIDIPDKRRKLQISDIYVDDGDETHYQQRIQKYVDDRRKAKRKLSQENQGDDGDEGETWSEEDLRLPDPTHGADDWNLAGGYKLPGEIKNRLFPYQRIAIEWMWGLCQEGAGGLLGDEMGLGKTIQVISFLAGLWYSNMWKGPVVIICPATLLKQWVQEFHRWFPPLRVAVLHSTGAGTSYETILKKILRDGHILITTYAAITNHADTLIPPKWGYAILDEGHKIRNPDAHVTLCCKQFKTVNRIVLTGTPMQNNLIELWCMYDFIFPGKLGTLPVFQQEFAIAINMGGYANATPTQIQTAYQCTVMLRDLIKPYILRRLKEEVIADKMPGKTEQVLFCKLTKFQRSIYKDFLSSKELEAIFDGKREALYGIDILRKVCNHPDLLLRKELMAMDEGGRKMDRVVYGAPKKAGKMRITSALLRLWKGQGHRVLLFSQTRQMLDIIEAMVQAEGHTYRRMDGTTSIKFRTAMVDEYNSNPNIFVFLLTTKVGGLGINLTGGNRVIIYDPDWNPSTDIQARERAWRLGQTRDVTIYRLMTAGTIEEKIYHRQIFKQFLSNKVLKDPKQRRFFKSRDLKDLFTLGADDGIAMETAGYFEDSQSHFTPKNELKAQSESSIRGIARTEEYDPTNEIDKEKLEAKKESQEPLQNLLKTAGVVSTFNNDKIMDVTRPENHIIQKEANRVAERALAALRQSKLDTQKASAGTLTWTGRSGIAGKPQPKANADSSKPSALSLLSAMNVRSGVKPADTIEVAPSILDDPSNQESLITRIISYLNAHDGQARSDVMLEALQIKLEDHRQAAVYRSMLRGVAVFTKSGAGGVWDLKPEFRVIEAA